MKTSFRKAMNLEFRSQPMKDICLGGFVWGFARGVFVQRAFVRGFM